MTHTLPPAAVAACVIDGLAPLDFEEASLLRGQKHGLCHACLEAPRAYYIDRVGPDGAHRPNLYPCRDCRDDVLTACRSRRRNETVRCWRIAPAGEAWVPVAVLRPAPAIQLDLFAGPAAGGAS